MDETPQQRTGAVLGTRKVSLVPFNVRWVYGTSNMLYAIFVRVSILSISDHSLCLMLQPWWFGVSPLFCICMFSHFIETQGNRWPVFLDLDFGVEEFDLVTSISALSNVANLDAGQLTQHHPLICIGALIIPSNLVGSISRNTVWTFFWGRNIIRTWSPKGRY